MEERWSVEGAYHCSFVAAEGTPAAAAAVDTAAADTAGEAGRNIVVALVVGVVEVVGDCIFALGKPAAVVVVDIGVAEDVAAVDKNIAHLQARTAAVAAWTMEQTV